MILSITLDNKIGGIATSLISYSKALNLINEEHWVVLPDNAPVIKDIEKIANVRLVKIKKPLLKFHIYTNFFFNSEISFSSSFKAILILVFALAVITKSNHLALGLLFAVVITSI